MEEIPIESLKLSVRVNNVLHRMSIHHVEQLLDTPIENIADQRNVGLKTITEICDAIEKIRNGETDIDCLDVSGNGVSMAMEVTFSEDQMEELSHHSITELDIPTRALNALMRIQCVTVDQLVSMSEDEIRNIKGLGVKSANEMILGIKTWLENNMFLVDDQGDGSEDIAPEEMEYYKGLEVMLSPITHLYWRRLKQIIEASNVREKIIGNSYETVEYENIEALFELPELEASLKKYYMHLIPGGIVELEELREKLSQQNFGFDSNILFNKLCDGTVCTVKDDYCFSNREHFFKYVTDNCYDVNNRNNRILIKRIQGDNLQTIGDEYGLTRERVRQILAKTVKKFPLMYEDFFKEPYEYFKFSKEEFCNAFPSCEETGYEYLCIRYSKGRHILDSKSINNYSGLLSKRLKEYLAEESIRRDKKSVSRTDMVYRVLISNSDKAMSLDEFEHEYYNYIERRGYPKDRLRLNIRTVTNHLRNAKHIVFDKNNCVRFCDADPEKIWNTVDFRQYKNLVISAELIFRDYEDLMEELDIRDGYELFYVIKSSLEYWDDTNFEINCRRIPVMVIGEGNEERQALQLLREVSPVSFFEYYEAYEERYGLKKESAQGNTIVSGLLSKYYSDGQYSINVPAIDERDVEPFKSALSSRTIWFMEELEKEFRRVCVNSSADAMNAAAFKRIGYSLNVGYAYNDSYGTVFNYFDKEIFSDDIVDMTVLERRIVNLPAFVSAFDKKKKTLEYIEVAPKILMSISEVQRSYGIDENDIRYLQEWIVSSCEDKYFNAHSLWEKINQNPIVNKMQSNEWMCTCIFRQQDSVFSLPVAGGIILSKNSGELSIGKISEWLVKNNGKMTIQNLTNLFNDTFATNIPVYKIADKLKTYGAWDDCVTDSFEDYIDTLVCNTNMDMDEGDFFQEEFF